MKIDLTKKIYTLDGEVFKIPVKENVTKDYTLLDSVKTALNTPKDGQKFTTEESAKKVQVFINIKKAEALSSFDIDSEEITLVKETLKPITPPESYAQIDLLLEGKENPFEPKN